MKQAKIAISLEALSDLLRLSGLDIWVTSVGMTKESGVAYLTVSGSGLPNECGENTIKQLMLAYKTDVIELNGTEVVRADGIDISKGYVVVPKQNAEIYGVRDFDFGCM